MTELLLHPDVPVKARLQGQPQPVKGAGALRVGQEPRSHGRPSLRGIEPLPTHYEFHPDP